MLQNPCKTLGFKKNMVYKIPPGGEVNHIQPVAYKPIKEYHPALICHITVITANTIKNIIPCIICIINLTCRVRCKPNNIFCLK